MRNFTAIVEDVDYDIVMGRDMWIGGGDMASLRLYRAHHPHARIYPVTFRGRSVWMTLKQFAIWRECLVYKHRGLRLTLKRLSEITGASRSTVSRFLRRLDFWRFIDLATIVGRGGGTYIFTNANPFRDAECWDAGARITQAGRKRARFLLAQRVRRMALERVKPMLDAVRIVRMPWWRMPTEQQAAWSGMLGNTGATFTRGFGSGG